jgi:SAM-dependent methyltransferase
MVRQWLSLGAGEPMVSVARCLGLQHPEAVLEAYLAHAPLAHALFRATEAHHLRNLRLRRPLLDLGCGTGEFALHALRQRVDVGLDIARERLDRARATGMYRRVQQGDARRLPFGNNCFGAVLAVSVLEHVPCPEAVVGEAFRVLRPGGRFVATVVLADLHQHLFYPALGRRLGLSVLGRLYARWQDKLFRHCTLLTKEDWDGILGGAGFRLVISHKILSPTLTAWWDALLAVAWVHRRHGRPKPVAHCPPAWLRALVRKLFRRLLERETDQGSNLLLVAEKPDAKDGRDCGASIPPGSVITGGMDTEPLAALPDERRVRPGCATVGAPWHAVRQRVNS